MHRRRLFGILAMAAATTGAVHCDDFIQKGNPVIPIGMKVKVDDLKPGSYRLLLQAVDSAKNNAPNRMVDFDISE